MQPRGGFEFAERVGIAIQRHQERGLASLQPQSALYKAFLANGRKLIGIYEKFRYINQHPSQAAAERATKKSMRTNAKLEKQAHKLGADTCYAGSA